MSRTITINLLVVITVAVWQGWSLLTMLGDCTTRARAIIAAADPLDRTPPPNVAAAIARNIPFEEMVDMLTTTLLDRYACRGNKNWSGTDWLVDHPALSSRLRATFSKADFYALFASTADIGNGNIGLSRGAKRINRRETIELSDDDLDCLVLQTVGKVSPQSHPMCAIDNPVPSKPIVN